MTQDYMIYIHTNDKEYTEHWYGLVDVSNRLLSIQDCNNINYIDLVDALTGEVLISIEYGKVVEVSTTYIVKFYEEIGC